MDEIYGLNEADRSKLKQLWDDFVSRRTHKVSHLNSYIPQSPEVLIAKTPSGGIPAMEEVGTGTGGDDVSPGSADCPVYRLLDIPGTGTGADDEPYFLRLENQTRTIYNITESEIEGDAWILIIKDKFGNWIAQPSPESQDEENRWKFVRPTSEDLDENGYYPGFVQEWDGSEYYDGEPCWIKLAAGGTLCAGVDIDGNDFRYEGEPLTTIDADGTGTAEEPIRIYGIAGNTIECAPDECDSEGNVVSWCRIYHRAPFKIVQGFTSEECAEGGTGTG